MVVCGGSWGRTTNDLTLMVSGENIDCMMGEGRDSWGAFWKGGERVDEGRMDTKGFVSVRVLLTASEVSLYTYANPSFHCSLIHQNRYASWFYSFWPHIIPHGCLVNILLSSRTGKRVRWEFDLAFCAIYREGEQCTQHSS